MINTTTYHNTIEIKFVDVKSNSYAEYNVDSNAKDPKFKIGDHGRISKYGNIFAKGYAPNRSEKEFVIKNLRLKILLHGHMLLMILKVVCATVFLVFFSSVKESACETWENVFYFTSKALLVLEKIKF